jgi:hypothetical protein
VTNQKDLFEEKFMEAVKAKEEFALRQGDEIKKLKAQVEEQMNQIKMQYKVESKNKEQLITEQDLKIHRLTDQNKSYAETIKQNETKIKEYQK